MSAAIQLDEVNGVTQAVVDYFTHADFGWYWGDTCFYRRHHDSKQTVRLYVGGWQARSYTPDEPFLPGFDWQGPFFADPISCYVHAEVERWGTT